MLNFREELGKLKEEKLKDYIYIVADEALNAVLKHLKRKSLLNFFSDHRYRFEAGSKKPILYIKKYNTLDNIIFQKELKDFKEVDLALGVLKSEFSKCDYIVQGSYNSNNFSVIIKP